MQASIGPHETRHRFPQLAAGRRRWLILEYTEVWPGVCQSIALVPSEAAHCGGAIMMKLRAIRTASFSLFFLLSGFALALAQASPPDPTEPPSRLTLFAHDVSN